ncbi:MAG: GtrA family protein [Anaerofustis sp.]
MSLFSKWKENEDGKFQKLLKQFIKFGIVGVSNTLISLAIYYLFVYISSDLYIWGNTVGFVISVLNAYYWNNKYVFKKSSKGNIKPLLKTYICYGSTFLLGTLLLYVMVHYLSISAWIAPLINLVITIPINFFLNKIWAFK